MFLGLNSTQINPEPPNLHGQCISLTYWSGGMHDPLHVYMFVGASHPPPLAHLYACRQYYRTWYTAASLPPIMLQYSLAVILLATHIAIFGIAQPLHST